MKVKMEKRPSIVEWAKRNNISKQVVDLYNKARRNFRNIATRYARKYGGEAPVNLGLPDVRTWSTSYPNLEGFLESKALTQIDRNKRGTKLIEDANRRYLENILLAGDTSNSNDAKEFDELREILNRGDRAEIADLIAEIGTDALDLAYKKTGSAGDRNSRKSQIDEIDIDFTPLFDAINRFTGD